MRLNQRKEFAIGINSSYNVTIIKIANMCEKIFLCSDSEP